MSSAIAIVHPKARSGLRYTATNTPKSRCRQAFCWVCQESIARQHVGREIEPVEDLVHALRAEALVERLSPGIGAVGGEVDPRQPLGAGEIRQPAHDYHADRLPSDVALDEELLDEEQARKLEAGSQHGEAGQPDGSAVA